MGQTGWLLVDCNLRMYVTGMRAFDEKLESRRGKCAVQILCSFCGMRICRGTAVRHRPPSRIFYIYSWLNKIYGCFSAKPENCGEGTFRLEISVFYQIYD